MATALCAYDVLSINSEVTRVAEFDERIFEQNYEFIFWHMSEVKYFTNVQEAKQYFADKGDHILSIRAFNQDEEYYFWKNGSVLTGRFRKDATDEMGDDYAIDTEMLLRSVVLPEKTGQQNEKYFLRTRNYISNEGFGYADSRSPSPAIALATAVRTRPITTEARATPPSPHPLAAR